MRQLESASPGIRDVGDQPTRHALLRLGANLTPELSDQLDRSEHVRNGYAHVINNAFSTVDRHAFVRHRGKPATRITGAGSCAPLPEFTAKHPVMSLGGLRLLALRDPEMRVREHALRKDLSRCRDSGYCDQPQPKGQLRAKSGHSGDSRSRQF